MLRDDASHALRGLQMQSHCILAQIPLLPPIMMTVGSIAKIFTMLLELPLPDAAVLPMRFTLLGTPFLTLCPSLERRDIFDQQN